MSLHSYLVPLDDSGAGTMHAPGPCWFAGIEGGTASNAFAGGTLDVVYVYGAMKPVNGLIEISNGSADGEAIVLLDLSA